MQANRYLWSDVRGRRRVADAFVELLGAAGTVPVFTMPAESLNPIVDAIRRSPRHRLVVVRNEAAGALMASAYAKVTGTVGVCLGTAGPGATHLPLGAYDATADRVPVLAVSGQVAAEHVGSGYFQELDSVRLFADATAWTGLVTTPGQAALMTTAMSHALRNQAAAHLAVTVDTLAAALPAPIRPVDPSWLVPAAVDDKDSLAEVLSLLAPGRTAVVVGRVGGEVPAAIETLAVRTGAAVLVLPEGYGYFREPRSYPAVKVGQDRADTARALLAEAGGVVVVGPLTASVARLLPNGCPVVQVAPLSEYGRPRPMGVTRLVGDQAHLLRQLAEAAPGDRGGGLTRALDEVRWDPDVPPDVARTWRELDAALPVDAVLSVEPGPLLDGAFRWLPVRERTVVSSYGLAATGFALPGAIGAAYGGASRAYALATSDGLAESMAELQTVRRHELPITVVAWPQEPPMPGGIDHAAFAAACGVPVHAAGPGGAGEALADPGPGSAFVALAAPAAGRETIAVRSGRRGSTSPAGTGPADVLGRALAAEGVDTVYVPARPGLRPLLAAWEPALRITAVAQAESAALMASAAGKLGAAPAVCVTGTPGDLVMQLNGLYDAAFDGSPVVVLTVEEAHDVVRSTELLAGVVRASVRLTPGPDGTAAVRAAVRLAAAERAVVHVRVDRAALACTGSEDAAATGGPGGRAGDPATATGVPAALTHRRVLPAEPLLAKAARMLDRCRRPAILVGRGAVGARHEVEQLAELLAAPVLTTLGGRGVLPDDHPLLLGGVGSSGQPVAMRALSRCDLLVVLGVSHRGTVFDVPGRFVAVRVDRDPAQLRLPDRPGVGLCGTARDVLQDLIARLSAVPPADRQRAVRVPWAGRAGARPWYTRVPGRMRPDGVQPSLVARGIGPALDSTGRRGVVTVDVGLVTLWVYRFLTGDHDTVWTGSFATMGFALPAGVVAGQRHPDRPVVAVCGDGGIAVTMAELATVGRLALPVTVIVLNNGKLGAIKYEQQVMGWPEYGSHLWNCDFAGYAEACGVTGVRVDRPERVGPVLTEAVRSGRPYLLDVLCDPDELPVPAQGPHPLQVAGVLVTFAREIRRTMRGATRGSGPRQPRREPASGASVEVRRNRAQRDIR
ncbi:MAG TPA: thiamine pyrophosphate-dependent enzyme [Pilimelia sp.]|nr:thiamine pyrophosphate-dependent enzyme [Pilimelia sp.]